jgi:hypothetical protein
MSRKLGELVWNPDRPRGTEVHGARLRGATPARDQCICYSTLALWSLEQYDQSSQGSGSISRSRSLTQFLLSSNVLICRDEAVPKLLYVQRSTCSGRPPPAPGSVRWPRRRRRTGPAGAPRRRRPRRAPAATRDRSRPAARRSGRSDFFHARGSAQWVRSTARSGRCRPGGFGPDDHARVPWRL